MEWGSGVADITNVVTSLTVSKPIMQAMEGISNSWKPSEARGNLQKGHTTNDLIEGCTVSLKDCFVDIIVTLCLGDKLIIPRLSNDEKPGLGIVRYHRSLRQIVRTVNCKTTVFHKLDNHPSTISRLGRVL